MFNVLSSLLKIHVLNQVILQFTYYSSLFALAVASRALWFVLAVRQKIQSKTFNRPNSYQLGSCYLFQLLWYLFDHSVPSSTSPQGAVFAWEITKHYHSKMLMQCHASFQGRPLGFIQTSMLVFTLVSMVSLGSHTQAHIYIRDHQKVSYSNGKPGNIFHTRNVSVRP